MNIEHFWTFEGNHPVKLQFQRNTWDQFRGSERVVQLKGSTEVHCALNNQGKNPAKSVWICQFGID